MSPCRLPSRLIIGVGHGGASTPQPEHSRKRLLALAPPASVGAVLDTVAAREVTVRSTHEVVLYTSYSNTVHFRGPD